MRKIYEVFSLKDGSGKQLRRFHDTVQQHSRALKAMKEEPTDSFITALFELKLDKDTMFHWQKASQETEAIPHYDDLLKFLNLRAQAAETCLSEVKKQYTPKKAFPKSATALAAAILDSSSNCSLCKTQTPSVCLSPVQATPPREDVGYCSFKQCLSIASSPNTLLRCVGITTNAGSARSHTILCSTWTQSHPQTRISHLLM